jgi:hypothetical protein
VLGAGGSGEDFIGLAAAKLCHGDPYVFSRRLLTDFRRGLLGKVALDVPGVPGEAQATAATPASSATAAARLRRVAQAPARVVAGRRREPRRSERSASGSALGGESSGIDPDGDLDGGLWESKVEVALPAPEQLKASSFEGW